MTRVLVTGGAGFIGSHVVDRLRAAGHEPVVYDVRRSPFHADGSVEQVQGSILDLDALTEALRGCDAVMHLAAAADVGEVEKAPVESEELNASGTLSVLQAARAAGVRRVVYASTIWVYSDVDADSVDEDTPLRPPGHLYTATKLAGELYCRSYAELYELEYTILRFGIPYGPRARPAAVLPAFVGRALAGEPLTIAGSGEQTRRFVYVEDLAEGCVRALAPAAAGRVYNLVGDEDVSVRRIADTVRSIVGDVEIVHTEGRNGDFRGAEVCGARAAEELGWQARTPFAEGVRRYVEWHLQAAAAAAAPAAAAPPTRRRLALPRPSRQTVLRDGSLIGVGGAAGATIGLAAHFHHFRDPRISLALLALLSIAATLLARVDWARRFSDALLVVGSMVVSAGVALFAVTAGPRVIDRVDDNGVALLVAVVALILGALVGGRLATKLARA